MFNLIFSTNVDLPIKSIFTQFEELEDLLLVTTLYFSIIVYKLMCYN